MRTQILDVSDRRQLFIDDTLVAGSDGVRLTVNPPRKTNEKLIVADRPWEDRFVGPYCTVIEDDGVYRMWYESYYSKDDGKREGVLCYAESDDGHAWRKPAVGQISFRGSSADNNIVFPPPGKKYHGGTVFKDPVAPSAERYKLLYMTEDGVMGACSPDGLSWRVYDEHNPLMFHQSDTQNVCFWDDRINKYVAYVRMNRPVRDPNRIRHVGRSETTDFRQWPHADVVLSYDANDPPGIDLYNSAAIKYPFAPDVYFIITSYFSHVTDTMEPRLATSRDGIHWSRPSREAFIALGEGDAFDSKMIHACVGQFRRDDKWWTFYRGTDRLHSTHGQRHVLPAPTGVISRVVSRVDGFVSIDAAGEGSFTTVPLCARGTQLQLNYATVGDEGFVKVELCDREGRAIDGYRAERCPPLTGDERSAPVRWEGHRRLHDQLDQPHRLRFRMRNAKVFGFQFAGQEHA